MAAPTEPVCGKCGYCVRGVSALVCPECGSDLREVGIIAPNMRVPLSPLYKAIAWTLMIPLPALIISSLLMETVLPFSVKHKIDRRIVCSSPALNVTLDVYATEWPWQPGFMGRTSIRPYSVRITDARFTGLIEADLSSGIYHYWWARGLMVSQQAGFNGAAIANWLSGSGVNAADPQVRRLCDQIYTAVNELHLGLAGSNRQLVDQNGKAVGTVQAATAWIVYDEPNPIIIGVLGIFWLVIWIYGLRRIYARRRGVIAPT